MLKCTYGNGFDTFREHHFLENAFRKAFHPNVLERVRKYNVPQTLAVLERALFESPQQWRQFYVLQPTFLKALLSDILETFRQPNSFQVLAALERTVLDPFQCGR